MATMTSKERLLAAIKFTGPDRVPISPRCWRYLLKHNQSQSIETYLEYAKSHQLDPLLYIGAGPVYMIPQPGSDYGRLGNDIRVDEQRSEKGDTTIFKRTIHTPAGRLTDEIHKHKPGEKYGIGPNDLIVEYPVKSAADLPALDLLVTANVTAHPVRDYHSISQEIGQRGLVLARTESALSHNAGDAYPQQQMMMDCYDQPQFVRSLIDIFQKHLMAIMKQVLENGAEAVYCSTFYESIGSGWSPQIYREFFLPHIKACVDLAHEYDAVYQLYDDGKVLHTLPMFREIGIDCVATVCPPPSGDVELDKARELAGNELCLNGGVDTVNTVWRGSVADVEEAVRNAIEAATTPAGGYILGTSDSITEQTPVENFDAFFAAGVKYGQI